jgi:hypothetical protein
MLLKVVEERREEGEGKRSSNRVLYISKSIHSFLKMDSGKMPGEI